MLDFRGLIQISISIFENLNNIQTDIFIFYMKWGFVFVFLQLKNKLVSAPWQTNVCYEETASK